MGRNGWISPLKKDNVKRVHDSISHRSQSSMLGFLRRKASNTNLPASWKHNIQENASVRGPCSSHVLLSQTPKLTIPPPSTDNIAVSLDVMHNPVRGSKTFIFVMYDCGDKLLSLSQLENDTAKTALDAYFIRWISIFDSPIFTVVYRGTDIAAK